MSGSLFDKNNIGKLCILQNGEDKYVCLYVGYCFDKIADHYWFLFLFEELDDECDIKIGDKEIGILKIPDKEYLKQITTYDLNSTVDHFFNLESYNQKWKYASWLGTWHLEEDQMLKGFFASNPNIDYILNLIQSELTR